jgi:alpha-galactosidase
MWFKYCKWIKHVALFNFQLLSRLAKLTIPCYFTSSPTYNPDPVTHKPASASRIETNCLVIEMHHYVICTILATANQLLMRILILFTFPILIALSNPAAAQSRKSRDFRSWASTPPMGWNSWDCFGPNVTEAEVKANADYMSRHLKKHGWQYIIVDIRWYVANDKAHGYNETDPQFSIDEYGRFTPAIARFPSAANGKGFKPLADYIHKKGLKFGIHMMRGIPVTAVKQGLPIMGTSVTTKDIYSQRDQCRWLKDMYTIEAEKKGAQEYYNSLFKLYAEWGVDYVKVDDLSAPIYHAPEIEMIRKAIDATGRKILLSTSPGETPIQHAPHIQQHANLWRTVDDFWDKWNHLKDHFTVFKRWNQYRQPGTWPDGDMLPLGHIGIRAERGNDRMTLFTKDEQYTLMTLWCIFRSPLMFGGHLPDNDDFTLSLLNNKKVLKVLKYSTNNRELFNSNDKIAWVADDTRSKDKFLAVFYASDSTNATEANITIDLKQLGFESSCKITDLWTGKKLGKFKHVFSPVIRKHGAGLYRIKK